jgi:hypothetical protein
MQKSKILIIISLASCVGFTFCAGILDLYKVPGLKVPRNLA